MQENEKMKTETIFENDGNQQNTNSEIKSKNKKLTIVLVALIILLILAIGVCAGLWFAGDTTKIINKTEENQEQIKEDENTTKEEEEIKKDNPDKVENEDTSNNQNNTNTSSVNKIFNTTLKDIEEVSVAIIDENNTSAKVDIDKDGVEETIKVEKVKGEYDETWKLYVNDKVFFDHNTNQVQGIFRYFFKLYIVDLDSSDDYYDIVIRGVDGSERRYCMFKYNGTTFNPILKSTDQNAIVFNGDSLYVDNLGTVVPQEYCFVHTNPVLSNRYYSYRENKVYDIPVGNYTNDLIEFKNVYFTTKVNNIGFYMENASKGDYDEEELLKKSGISYYKNIKVYIVEYDNDPYMIKVKLEDGTFGYIFTSEGVFAG